MYGFIIAGVFLLLIGFVVVGMATNPPAAYGGVFILAIGSAILVLTGIVAVFVH